MPHGSWGPFSSPNSQHEEPLCELLKSHRPCWNIHALLQQAELPDAIAAARAAVKQLPKKIVAQAGQELHGLPKAAITLSLALCMQRRGHGGRRSGPDPALDPNISPTHAHRIMENRRTAAVSKILQKVKKLADLAREEGVLQRGTTEGAAAADAQPAADQTGQSSASIPGTDMASRSSGSHGSVTDSQAVTVRPAVTTASAQQARAACAQSSTDLTALHAQKRDSAVLVAAAAGGDDAVAGPAAFDDAPAVPDAASPAAAATWEPACQASMGSMSQSQAALPSCGNPVSNQMLAAAAAAGFSCGTLPRSVPAVTMPVANAAHLPLLGLSSIKQHAGQPAAGGCLADRQSRSADGAADMWAGGQGASAAARAACKRPTARRISYDCAGVHSLLPQLQQQQREQQQQQRELGCADSGAAAPHGVAHANAAKLAELQDQLLQAQEQMRELVMRQKQLQAQQGQPSATPGMLAQGVGALAAAGSGRFQEHCGWAGGMMSPASSGMPTDLSGAGYGSQHGSAGGVGLVGMGSQEGTPHAMSPASGGPATPGGCGSWDGSMPVQAGPWNRLGGRYSLCLDMDPATAHPPSGSMYSSMPAAAPYSSNAQQQYSHGFLGGSFSGSPDARQHKRMQGCMPSSMQLPQPGECPFLEGPAIQALLPSRVAVGCSGMQQSLPAGLPCPPAAILPGVSAAVEPGMQPHGPGLTCVPCDSTAATNNTAGLPMTGMQGGALLPSGVAVGQASTWGPAQQLGLTSAFAGANPGSLLSTAGSGQGLSSSPVGLQLSMEPAAVALPGSSAGAAAAPMSEKSSWLPVQTSMSAPLPYMYAGAGCDQRGAGAGCGVLAPALDLMRTVHTAPQLLQQQQGAAVPWGAAPTDMSPMLASVPSAPLLSTGAVSQQIGSFIATAQLAAAGDAGGLLQPAARAAEMTMGGNPAAAQAGFSPTQGQIAAGAAAAHQLHARESGTPMLTAQQAAVRQYSYSMDMTGAAAAAATVAAAAASLQLQQQQQGYKDVWERAAEAQQQDMVIDAGAIRQDVQELPAGDCAPLPDIEMDDVQWCDDAAIDDLAEWLGIE